MHTSQDDLCFPWWVLFLNEVSTVSVYVILSVGKLLIMNTSYFLYQEVFPKLIHNFLLQQVYFEGWMTSEHWHSEGFRCQLPWSAENMRTWRKKKKKTFCARAIQSWHSLLINCAALGAENMSSNWIWNYVPQYCPSVKKIKKSLLIVAYNQ